MHRNDSCSVFARTNAAGGDPRDVFEFDGGQWRRTAREHRTLGAFLRGERGFLVRALFDGPVGHYTFALAATAVTAFVGERDALAQHRLEDRFPLTRRDDSVIGAYHQMKIVLRPAFRRQPRQDHEQQREDADHRPHAAGRPSIEQRVHRQIEPVERDGRRRRREIGGVSGQRGLDQRQHQKGQRHADPDRSWRLGLRPRHPLRVDPQEPQYAERQADVQERQQREQAVVHRVRRDEVADQCAIEHRQPVEPFGRGNGHELRRAVPWQHVAVDARDVNEPQQDHARYPRKPAEAPVVVEHEMADQVEHHRQYHRIGRVAVKAAHDAAQPPLFMRQVLDRIVSLVNAGLEEDVEIEAARDDDPQQVIRDGAEVVERVQRVTEHLVEDALGSEKSGLPRALDELQHSRRETVCVNPIRYGAPS